MAIEYGTPARYLPAPRDNATTDLIRNAVRAPDAPAFARWLGGTWRTDTWAEFAEQATTLAAGLVTAGIAPGDRVALMAGTSIEWVRADYAIWLAGAVSVPIAATAQAAETAWILRDSGAVAAFTGDDRHYALMAGAGVRHIWSTSAGGLDEPAAVEEVERRRNALTSGTLATIVYPPGGTRGARLSHGNLTAAVHTTEGEVFDWHAELLVTVPLTNILARVTQLAAVHSGTLTAHATDPAHLGDALLSFRPTVLLAEPAALDRFDPGTAHTAVAYGRALDTGRVPLALRVRRGRHPRQLAPFGGRVTHVVTGGPLSPHLAWFLRGIGLTVLDSYARTETTGAVTCNLPAGTRTGTAGRPLPGCRVRITRDGEILVRGATVFQGNWGASTPALDEDGWFHTGNRGHLDDGYLTVGSWPVP
ncbi:MAG: AMP-binding protein [Actinophytocola sp.]|uniref:AMP-binding protein n=1 Tax=Actinophytocola sp. TaxID=1872138 RepID=UPI003C77028D